MTGLRDTRADEAYFAGIVEHLGAFIRTDDDELALPDSEWPFPEDRALAAGDAMRIRWARFSALYSSGADEESLRAEFATILSRSAEATAWARKDLSEKTRSRRFAVGADIERYRQGLWLISLALVFDVDEESFDKAVDAVGFGWGDRLLDRLIASRRPAHPIGESLAFPAVVAEVDEAWGAASSANAEDAIGRYLSSWYPRWKGAWGWAGHELIAKRKYWGYWSFETLGVVAALGLDDSSFRDNEYYPRDLAGL